jgi:hypothetical protein
VQDNFSREIVLGPSWNQSPEGGLLRMNLEAAKTDDQGKAIHEDCYTRQVSQSTEKKPVSGAKA